LCAGGCSLLIIQGEEREDFNGTGLVFNTRYFRIDLFGEVPGTASALNFISIIANGGKFSSSGDAARLDTFVQSSDSTILLPIEIETVPEPGSLSFVMVGLTGLWLARRISRAPHWHRQLGGFATLARTCRGE
jgi:hypothetical protein